MASRNPGSFCLSQTVVNPEGEAKFARGFAQRGWRMGQLIPNEFADH